MSRPRVRLARVACAALAIPLALGSTQAAQADLPQDDGPGTSVPLTRFDASVRPSDETPQPVISPSLAAAAGIVTAFVELNAPSGLQTAEAGGSTADIAAAAADVEQLAENIVPADAGAGVSDQTPAKLTVTTDVVSGMVVTGDADEIRALTADPTVATIRVVVPKTIDNKGTDPFTEAMQTWTATGATGEGVTIGVIDTGMDYTHADFGGPGTPEAYEAAYGTDGTGAIPDGLFDPGKFLGGYDFAGPTYDASGKVADGTPYPTPDANPIDAPSTAGGGHGSHVTGTAAGYGLPADGSPFTGDYATLTDISDWLIGPGSAPESGVYALKVFGDVGGSTNLVIDALEWAADPNGDGDYADHLDLINMSLGSDFSSVDDPENLFVDALATLGVLTVTSAGNGGDATDIAGSPAGARTALSVANSIGNTQTNDAVDVVSTPEQTALGLQPAQNSVDYTLTDDVTAPVAFIGDDVTGCTSLEDYTGQITGAIVWLSWDDNDTTRACGSKVRWDNAEAAGAVGVLIGTQKSIFAAGIAGNATIPGAQLTSAATEALLPQIRLGGTVVRLGPSLAQASFVTDDVFGDMLSSSSSRGEHGSLGVIKPDVAAPGTLISSVASSSGTGRVTYSGTSMASPHVAGIAALVAQTHPEWTPAQLKAAVMNTATHDVYSELGQTGAAYGPERVGSGRVDAPDAVGTGVIAYATDAPDLVSVTFGIVAVGAQTVTQTRTVTVSNTTSADRTYATSFARSTSAGGATITASPAEVTVPAQGTAEVTLTLTADPATLARDIDPTMAASYDLDGGTVAREYVTSISGRLVLTPADGTQLRVPVQAAPRPTSELTTAPVTFAPGATTAPLTITGRRVDSGGWESLMAPFALMATSPALDVPDAVLTSPSTIAAADLRYVGFSSTAPDLAAAGGDPAAGTIALGIVTEGEWASLGAMVIPLVDVDIDGDGINDLETHVIKYADGLDLTTVETYALTYSQETGYGLGPLLDIYEANGLTADMATAVFDSNVTVVPMNLAAVGIEPGDTPTFTVAMYSPYAQDPSGIVDQADPFTVDPFDPPVWFDSDPAAEDGVWFFGQPGTDVTVHRSADTGDTRILVLHTLNGTDQRGQVVDATVEVPTSNSTLHVLAPSRIRNGAPLRIKPSCAATGPHRTERPRSTMAGPWSCPPTCGPGSVVAQRRSC